MALEHARGPFALTVGGIWSGDTVVDGVVGMSEPFSIDGIVGVGDGGSTAFALRGAFPNPAREALR